MFGHDNQTQGSQDTTQDAAMATTADMPAADGTLGVSMDAATTDMTPPAGSDTPDSLMAGATASDGDMPPFEPTDSGAAQMSSPSRQMDAQTPDELIGIKQEALQALKPLVGHLDQTPEEKFRTTMMMIQAADDQSLIPDAYEAAKSISDEKTRAQALLDVVNEINYFTAQNAK